MSHKRRILVLECITLESQIARLQEHYRSLSRADLDLIISISDSQQTGVWTREYSAEKIATFENHCDFLATIPDSAHDESTRRVLGEMLVTGKITRAEIRARWGPEFLP